MGRNALSDEEKKRRGTFRPDKSEEARKAEAVGNVLAFPVLTTIPPCSFPFEKDSKGDQAYKKWATDLFNAGLLTEISKAQVEQYALTEHNIASYFASGKPVPARQLDLRRAALVKLEMLNVDTNLVESKTQSGVFKTNGFAGRLRRLADHKAKRSG